MRMDDVYGIDLAGLDNMPPVQSSSLVEAMITPQPVEPVQPTKISNLFGDPPASSH